MNWVILDSSGNLVESFDDEAMARATMTAIVCIEPEAAEHLVTIVYDDQGLTIGDPIMPSPPATQNCAPGVPDTALPDPFGIWGSPPSPQPLGVGTGSSTPVPAT